MDRRGRGRALRCALVVAALVAGCEAARQAGDTVAFTLNPVASTGVTVSGRSEHGPYLFVEVQGPQLQQGFVTPASDACARVVEPGAQVTYAKHGNFGRFRRDGEACDAVGSLSLAQRRQKPRDKRRGDSAVPRATARFRVVHRDEQAILLRGRFALATRVGIPGSFDVVAILPDSEPCRDVASRREATLEFRLSGPEPFRLLAGRERCVVTGFATPVQGAPAPASITGPLVQLRARV